MVSPGRYIDRAEIRIRFRFLLPSKASSAKLRHSFQSKNSFGVISTRGRKKLELFERRYSVDFRFSTSIIIYPCPPSLNIDTELLEETIFTTASG